MIVGALALLPLAYIVRGYAVPLWVNPRVEAQDRAALRDDIAPLLPMKATSVTGLVLSGGRSKFDKATCDELCLILLYSGQAEAVVTAPSLNAQPREALRWTLEKRGTPCLLPRTGYGGDRWSRLPQVRDTMHDRALLGECLVSRPGRLRDAGLVIGHEIIGGGRGGTPDLVAYPELSGGRISLWRFDDIGRATLLVRETWREPRRLTPFLHKTHNGSVNSPGWVLARLPEPNKAAFSTPEFAIGRFLTLDLARLRPAAPGELRRVLDDWLDHPERLDALTAIELEGRFGRIVRKEAEPADVARLERLIRDEDLYATFVDIALDVFPEEMPRFRDALLARFARTPPEVNENYSIDDALAEFPIGAFADRSPLILSLLADRERAVHLDNLIMRLADGGPAAAPLLFHLFEANLEEDRDGPPPASDVDRPNNRITKSALRGLCRLGPAISPSYRRIEAAATRDPLVGRWLMESQEGAVTRVRLGRPIETIEPAGDEPKAWMRNVRALVAQQKCND